MSCNYADTRVGPVADAVRTIASGTSQDLSSVSTGIPLALAGHYVTIKAVADTEVSFSAASVTPSAVAGWPMKADEQQEFIVPAGCKFLNAHGGDIVVFLSSRDTISRGISNGLTK